MTRFNSLLGRNKFPVPMRRELARKPLNLMLDSEPVVAHGVARDCLLQRRVGGKPVRRWRATAARTTGTVKSATIAVGRTTRRSEYHVLSAWTAGPSDPIMRFAVQELTPDRSRSRPKSRPARRCHPCSRGLSAGAPPRLGKGHPSSAAHRSDPPLTELAPLSPRGRFSAIM